VIALRPGLRAALAALLVAAAGEARAAPATRHAGGARTFHAARGGSGSFCSREVPCGSIALALSKLRPGDTLLIRGAKTDSEDAIWREPIALRGRSSPRGTPTARITIAAYPGEVVRIQPGARPLYLQGGAPSPYNDSSSPTCPSARCGADSPSYLTFGAPDSRLILDATGADHALKMEFASAQTVDAQNTGPHHVRFVNVTFRNARSQGVHLAAGDHNEFIDCEVHDNGSRTLPQDHGYYIATSQNVIRGGRIYRNYCMGVHLWSGYEVGGDNSGNVIEGVEIFENGSNRNGSCLQAKNGIGIYCSARNVVRSCTIRDNYGNGIQVGTGAYDTRIVGNRVHDNNRLSHGAAGIEVGGTDWGCGGPREVRDDLLPERLRGAPRRGGAVKTAVIGNKLWKNAPRGNRAPGWQIADRGVDTTLEGNVLGP
jgi:hypothetical protein